jgi:primary-amine oxidase
MTDIKTAPTDKNPYGSGITREDTTLRTQGEGRTHFSAESGRIWSVLNENKLNSKNGLPTGWKLIPQNTPPLLMKKDSPLREKASFLDYDIWVTKYKEGQLFAAGDYLNKSGLPEWVGKEPEVGVVDTDIVLWHNFGMTHFPRVEDFPVMPVE